MDREEGAELQWALREINQNESSLTHYGVKGMRWGIRKEYETKGRKAKPKVLNAVTKTKKTDSGDSEIRILDKKEYGVRQYLIDEGYHVSTYAPDNVALYNFNNLPKFNMRLSENQQAQAVNHDAPNNNRLNNCFECTMAYEMRRRGYNVQANENRGGYAFEAMHAFDIKNSFRLEVSSPDGSRLSSRTLAEEAYRRMEEQCLLYGNGARGMMGIYYAEPYDGGHAMSWVVEDGKFKIIDNQGVERDAYDTFLYCDANVDVYRLDDADVLPGVTDFVEPFKATDYEKANANKRYKQGQKIWKKEHRDIGKNAVEKVISNIGKNVGDFISKGMEAIGNFLKNSLNIKPKKSDKSSVTWEVK